MTDLKNRLEALSQTGTPRGANEVINRAMQEAMVRTSPTSGTSELPTRSRTRTAKRGGRVLTVGIAFAGITSTSLIGIAAYSALNDEGGYDSPTEAVEALARAIEQTDPLAAIATIAPTELPGFEASIRSASDKAEQVKLIKSSSEPFAWLDVELSDYELSVEYPDPAVAFVEVNGLRADFGTDPAGLGSLISERGYEPENDPADLSKGDRVDLQAIVTVKRGDGWFVSPAYTSLEWLRQSLDAPAADFSAPVVADVEFGAATPEEAIERAARGILAHDAVMFASAIDPNEFPIWAYLPMFRELERRWEAEGTRTITSLRTTVRESDSDTAAVDVAATYDYSSSDGRDFGHLRLENACIFPATADGLTSASVDFLSPGYLAGCAHAGVVWAFFSTPRDLANDPLIAIQRDDRWYASPTATLVREATSYAGRFDADWIRSESNAPWIEPLASMGGPVVPDATLEIGVSLTLEGTDPKRPLGFTDLNPPYVVALPPNPIPDEAGCVGYRLEIGGEAPWERSTIYAAVGLLNSSSGEAERFWGIREFSEFGRPLNPGGETASPNEEIEIVEDGYSARMYFAAGNADMLVIPDFDGKPITVTLHLEAPEAGFRPYGCSTW